MVPSQAVDDKMQRSLQNVFLRVSALMPGTVCPCKVLHGVLGVGTPPMAAYGCEQASSRLLRQRVGVG